MRAHLLSLSYRGHVCRGYKLRTLPLPSINAMPSTPQGSARRPNPTKPSRHARPRQVHVGVGWIPPLLKAPSNDTRPCPDPYKDAPDLHRMDITTPHSPPWGPGWRGPTGDRILWKEIRWRPPKCRNRLPRGLVQVGDALASRQALPDSPRSLGSRADRSRHMGFWEGGGKQRLRSGSWPLRTPSASMALGRTP